MKANRNIHAPNHKCLNCGKSFYRWPYEIKKVEKLCCSSNCAIELKHKKYLEEHPDNTVCAFCGKTFYRRPNRKRSKSGLYFCSRVCQDNAYKVNIIISGPNPKYLTKEEQQSLNRSQRSRLQNRRAKKKLNRKCLMCGAPIIDTNKSGYCVKCCAKARYANATQEQRHKWSEDAKKRMADGKIKPWQSRNILSYPEKFFKKVLENNNIEFEGPNYVVKQKDLGVPDCLPSSCYFLDFKIGNVDLEIDGKQHSYSDRKESDKVRDEYLTKAGYIVYRIKWKSINSENGKQYIKKEIDKLLEFLGRVA